MKELTIKEKAKCYDEAIERAKAYQGLRSEMEIIFPELKESEGERTWLINYLSNRILNSSIIAENENLKKAIAWLEKQGEQNLAFIEKGKWYVCIRTSYKPNGKDFIEGKTYYAKEDYKIIGECGEVDIATDNPEEFFRSATEEEINDIIKNFVNEQKPIDWSEEDSPYYDDICELLINILHSESRNYNMEAIKKDLDWLKSLKPQTTWKPSDEQMRMLDEVIRNPHLSTTEYNGLIGLMEQFKKLK